jgi:pimeloyl-ACP methyl ester carboxylesterase
MAIFKKFQFKKGHSNPVPKIVFLHGFLGGIYDWEEFCKDENLIHYDAFVIDLNELSQLILKENNLNVWESALLTPPHNFDFFEQVTLKIVSLFKDEKFIPDTIIGYSMGARLTLYMLAMHKHFSEIMDNVKSVISVGGHLGIEGEINLKERFQWELEWVLRAKENWEDFLKLWYQQKIYNGFFGDHKINHPPTLETNCYLVLGLSQQPNLSLQLKILPPEIASKLHYWVGENDEKYVKVSQALASLNPKFKIKTFQNSAHAIPFEVQKDFLKAILHHLENF